MSWKHMEMIPSTENRICIHQIDNVNNNEVL